MAPIQRIKCREKEATMLANVGRTLHTRWAGHDTKDSKFIKSFRFDLKDKKVGTSEV